MKNDIELNVYKKLLIALYVCRKHSKDYLLRKWCLDWMEGIDRTPETAFAVSQKGRTIAGKLGQAAYNLSRIEEDPHNDEIYTKIANDCIDLAVEWLKDSKEPEFEYKNYIQATNEYLEYIAPSLTRRYDGENVRYGKRKITREEYIAIIAKQDNRCWICGRTAQEARRQNSKNHKSLVLDHDHKNPNENKNMRGLLCHTCNSGLGMFYDNVEYLSKAVNYLRHFTPENQW